MKFCLKTAFGLIVSILLTLLLLLQASPVRADLGSCFTEIEPDIVVASVSASLTMTVGGGDKNIVYAMFDAPRWTAITSTSPPGGWTVSGDEDYAEFETEGSGIPAGGSLDFGVGIETRRVVMYATGWEARAGEGVGPNVLCSIAPIDVTISNIAITNISTSEVTVSWNTERPATTRLLHGIGGEWVTFVDGEKVPTHSVSLSGLLPETTYDYIIEGWDNYEYSGHAEGTFTTSAVTATATPTPTPGPTATPTPTPTPIPDTTGPTVSITADLSPPFKEAPLITGKASDSRSTISKIDYSTDGGENWLPVDTIEKPNTKSTTFDFIPYLFDDGNYEIQARATDSEGNDGFSEIHVLVIDRLPPRIGGNLLALGPQPLLPNEDGVIITTAGLEQKITLSAVGGPISVDLLVNEKSFSLDYSPETGLWSGMIGLGEPGFYRLKTKAIDGADNKTERELNPIAVVVSGKVVDGETEEKVTKGKISLFVQDPQSGIWAPWDAKTFGQENPQSLNEEGGYQFFLPPGTYYLQIKSPGFTTLTSRIFTLTQSVPFNAVFRLERGREITIGPFSFRLPGFLADFFAEKATVKLKEPSLPEDLSESELLNQEAFDFSLPTTLAEDFDLESLRGKASVLSFVSTWSPPALEQILVLDRLIQGKVIPVAVVITQETVSRVTIFQNRGNYKLPIVVDRDGDLVEEYNLNSLPTHYFLDREGVIKKIVTGVLNQEEFKQVLAGIH